MKLASFADGKILGGRVNATGYLVINNPARHNAISLDMWQSATEVLNRLSGDPKVRLLVISGAGSKAFASGADISKFDSERNTAEEVERYHDASAEVYDCVSTFAKPTIARIAGYCMGGGLALAVCCDIRICGADSRFALPAARIGLGYGYAAQKRLANVVGTSFASEILFTARQFSAEEAYDMGLVNRVVAPEDLEAFVDDYARRVAENAPLTIELAKAGKLAIESGAPGEHLARLHAMAKTCYASADYREGRRAFLEKRKPRFTGQ